MSKVLLISVVYEPDTVSTAGIVAGLARSLRDLGHDVSVLSSIPHYNPPSDVLADHRYHVNGLPPYRYSVESGIRVARCFVPQKQQGTLARARDFTVLHLTATVAALRLFADSDVAIVVSPPLTLAAIAFLLKAIRGTKVIYNAQELWPDVPRDLGVITNPLLLRVIAAVERTIYRRADAVTAIGQRFGEIIAVRGGRADRVVVIPNFVDTAWISPQPKVNALSEEWGLTARPVALYAGNVGLTQDFELVLAAAALVDVEFVIVGAGAGLAALTKLVEDRKLPNVQLRPFVGRDRVAELYGLADVVIVPLGAGHDRTTTPSKIYSAMAAGKPVLACAGNDTDLANELRVSAAGLSVSPGDVLGFVAALSRLLDLTATGRWRAAAALSSATRHSAGAVAADYDALIGTLSAGPVKVGADLTSAAWR
ncbi:MAG: glycosyltransferase family 4 protein [Geodermatophilaceae bacterium]